MIQCIDKMNSMGFQLNVVNDTARVLLLIQGNTKDNHHDIRQPIEHSPTQYNRL